MCEGSGRVWSMEMQKCKFCGFFFFYYWIFQMTVNSINFVRWSITYCVVVPRVLFEISELISLRHVPHTSALNSGKPRDRSRCLVYFDCLVWLRPDPYTRYDWTDSYVCLYFTDLAQCDLSLPLQHSPTTFYLPATISCHLLKVPHEYSSKDN